MPTSNHDFKNLVDLLRGVEVIMLSSLNASVNSALNPTSQLISRPLVLQEVDPDGGLWFFIGRSSTLANDLRVNPQVVVSHSDALETKYLSVSGRVILVEDRARISALWRSTYLTWFPLGISDPELLLIRVDVHSAERWLDGAHLHLVAH